MFVINKPLQNLKELDTYKTYYFNKLVINIL